MSQRIVKIESLRCGFGQGRSFWTGRQVAGWGGFLLVSLDYNVSFCLENAWLSDGEALSRHVHVPGRVPRITKKPTKPDSFGLTEGVHDRHGFALPGMQTMGFVILFLIALIKTCFL